MTALLLDWVLQPLGLVAALMVVAGLCRLLVGRSRSAQRHVLSTGKRTLRYLSHISFVGAFALLWLFSMPGIANGLVYYLENHRENPSECDTSDTHEVTNASSGKHLRPIVVLGGGLDNYVVSDDPYVILNRDSLLRSFKAVSLYSQQSEKRTIYLLGGGHSKRPVADIMSQVLEQRGVPNIDVIVETNSHSTHTNANEFEKLAPVAQHPEVDLITSAIHIPRAAATFEKLGYTVCHHAANTQYSPAVGLVRIMPYLAGLNKTTVVMHEALAFVIYKLKNYI